MQLRALLLPAILTALGVATIVMILVAKGDRRPLIDLLVVLTVVGSAVLAVLQYRSEERARRAEGKERLAHTRERLDQPK